MVDNRPLVAVAIAARVAAEWDLAPVEVAAIAARVAAPVEVVRAEVVSAAVVAEPVVPVVDQAADRAVAVTALCLDAACVAFAWTKSSILITRMLHACGNTSLSVPRSSHAAKPAHVLDTSAP
jgi:hypothetical protein